VKSHNSMNSLASSVQGDGIRVSPSFLNHSPQKDHRNPIISSGKIKKDKKIDDFSSISAGVASQMHQLLHKNKLKKKKLTPEDIEMFHQLDSSMNTIVNNSGVNQ
jgi:hypothetical protein